MEKSEFYRDARRDLTGPLDGVRVIDATTSWAGPMCACILADLGADVIKVEAREGEVSRRIPPALPGHEKQIGYAQATVNRNKRSLTLDLRRDEGREIFLKLAARSDIIVQNFRPGTFDKWGVGYDHARAVKPDIIYVSISGYGQFGPIHDRVAYDPLAQAMSGFISLNGTPDGSPMKAPTWLCDDLGGLHGAIGALAALRHRDRTGEGQHVDVAMLDAMLFQSNGNLTLGAMGVEIKRWGNEIPFSVPTNIYQCRDGSVMAGVLLDTHWKVMARMAGRHDLADHADFATIPGRMGHRAECNAMFAKWCETRTVDEAVDGMRQGKYSVREGANLRGGGAMPAHARARHAARGAAGRRQARADHRPGGEVLAHADKDTKRRTGSGSAYGQHPRGTWNRRRRAQALARERRRLATAPAAAARRLDSNALASLDVDVRFAG